MAQAVAISQETPTEIKSDSRQFLTFLLAGEVYGVDILDIKEIIEYGDLTTVPLMPDFIAGVLNLRGSVVPVVNLALRFTDDAVTITKRTSIIVIELEERDKHMEVGIMVDMVNEVLEIPEDDIEPAPAFGAKIRADFISGMGKINDKFLILLDVNHVLSIDELSALNQVAGEEYAAEAVNDTADAPADNAT